MTCQEIDRLDKNHDRWRRGNMRQRRDLREDLAPPPAEVSLPPHWRNGPPDRPIETAAQPWRVLNEIEQKRLRKSLGVASCVVEKRTMQQERRPNHRWQRATRDSAHPYLPLIRSKEVGES